MKEINVYVEDLKLNCRQYEKKEIFVCIKNRFIGIVYNLSIPEADAEPREYSDFVYQVEEWFNS